MLQPRRDLAYGQIYIERGYTTHSTLTEGYLAVAFFYAILKVIMKLVPALTFDLTSMAALCA